MWNSSDTGWIDLSIPLRDNMMQGNLEPLTPHIEHIRHRNKGDPINLTQININSHNGTHIDAPFHHFVEGTTIDKMPHDVTIGPTRVIEIKDTVSIKPEELAVHDIQAGERILFKTSTSSRSDRIVKFFEDFIYLTIESAHYLAEKKIRVVGIDYITIGPWAEHEINYEIHNILFNAEIFIIEDLDMSQLNSGLYEMICLPLRLVNGDACPARALVRPI